MRQAVPKRLGGCMVHSLRHASQLEMPLFYAMRKLKSHYFLLGDWWVVPRDRNKTYRIHATVSSAKNGLVLDLYGPDQWSQLDAPFNNMLMYHAKRNGFSSISTNFYVGNDKRGSFYQALNS